MTATQNYQVQIDDKAYQISDPIVTGRQILETTGKKTVDEYLVFQELQGGQLEELRLEETIDVRKAGVEKFITQKSDRTFYFVVDGERRPWPLRFITGWEIKKRADVDPVTHLVRQELRNAPDRLVADCEKIDLDPEGVERFVTVPKTIAVTVNGCKVNFAKNQATGLEIKKTSIQQGVSIQEDFVLFEVMPNSSLNQIGDNDSINLHEGQVFRATTPDDNS